MTRFILWWLYDMELKPYLGVQLYGMLNWRCVYRQNLVTRTLRILLRVWSRILLYQYRKRYNGSYFTPFP